MWILAQALQMLPYLGLRRWAFTQNNRGKASYRQNAYSSTLLLDQYILAYWNIRFFSTGKLHPFTLGVPDTMSGASTKNQCSCGHPDQENCCRRAEARCDGCPCSVLNLKACGRQELFSQLWSIPAALPRCHASA